MSERIKGNTVEILIGNIMREQEGRQIISELKKELLQMQGILPALPAEVDLGLSMMNESFPQEEFPLGRIHEFLCATEQSVAATSGFLSAFLSRLMQLRGFVIWISLGQELYAPGLLAYEIDPSRMIFINCRKEKELLWVLEETLKCGGLLASVAIVPKMNFTESRRLQLAVEKTRNTGFVLCTKVKYVSASAAIARWEVESLPSIVANEMPGIGFPAWNVKLLKIRNGKPGDWNLYWEKGSFWEYEHSMERHNFSPEKNKMVG